MTKFQFPKNNQIPISKILYFKVVCWKFFVICILCIGIFPFSIGAQTPPASSSATILRDSVKQKVAEELAAIKQAVSKKGFVGSITAKSDVSLTVVTNKNQPRTVLVTNDSVIKATNNKDITVADLKVGDYILAMGDVDSQNQMTAKRLLIIGKPVSDTRTTVFGTVSETAVSSFTITTPKADTLTLKLSSAVKYNDKYTAKDLKSGVKVIVLYTQTGSSFTAKRVYIFPSSVPSPTVKPTSTPRISPTP